MGWGLGVLALLAAVTWWLRGPESAPLHRAFGVLIFYGGVFWLSLFKVWWTAGAAAAIVTADRIGYQPLHRFSPRMIALDRVLFAGPRAGTQSLRLVHERSGEARELFLNLGVIDGRHEFLELLGERLEHAGLEPVRDHPHTWRRPGWDPEAPSGPEKHPGGD